MPSSGSMYTTDGLKIYENNGLSGKTVDSKIKKLGALEISYKHNTFA